MSLINTEIKPFKATAYHNGKFVPVSHEDFKGKWSVMVFYPADFTFVCPTELGDLADNYAEFKKLGVEIYGVSTDTHFTHKAWHDTSETISKGAVSAGRRSDPDPGAQFRSADRGPGARVPRHVRDRSFGPHQDHRGARQRHRPRREGIAAQGAGGAVRRLASGRGVSGEMDAGRQDAVAVPGSGRQDLTRQDPAGCQWTPEEASCSTTI